MSEMGSLQFCNNAPREGSVAEICERHGGQVPQRHTDEDNNSELIELRQRVLKLEALLEAFVAAFPTVVPAVFASVTGASSAAIPPDPAPDARTAAPFVSPAHAPGTACAAAGSAAATPLPIAAVVTAAAVPEAAAPPDDNRPSPSQPPSGPAAPAAVALAPAHTAGAGPAMSQALVPAGGSGGVSGAGSVAEVAGSCSGGGSGAAGGGAGAGFSVAMAATRVVMHQLVLPADVNQLGICTGGQVLSWIDVCAGLSAKTLAQGPCVTASVDAVHFLRPCRLGCVVIIAAMVSRTFTTSLEVTVVVESEDMRTGVRHHCCSAHLTFVVRPRAGAEGLTAGLPRVYPTTPDHRAVWEGAEVRRQQRLERRTRVRRNPELRDAERICRLRPITHREGGPTLPPAITMPPSYKQHSPARGSAAFLPVAAEAAGADTARKATAGSATDANGANGDTAAAAASASLSSSEAALGVSPPARQLVPPGCTTAYMTQSILPQHANTLNITFGGQVMSWMEQCAYISASRLRAPAMLTAAMDSVSFVRPTRVGDILYITAQVTAIFGSSLEVMVSVFGESPYSGAGSSAPASTEEGGEAAGGAMSGGKGADMGIFHCADAYVTVVAVDERHASPVPVPFELGPQEPADLLRYQGAVARRAERLALRGEFTAAECTRISLDGSHVYSPPPEAATVDDGLDAIPPL